VAVFRGIKQGSRVREVVLSTVRINNPFLFQAIERVIDYLLTASGINLNTLIVKAL
jgi:hypothetical protein